DIRLWTSRTFIFVNAASTNSKTDHARSGTAGMPDLAQSELDARQLRRLTVVLAIACGLAVANLYYAQPLLATLAHSFGVSKGSAALVVTLTQIGYAAGLLFVVPLGDLVENKKLATRVLIGTAAALGTAAGAPSLGVFLVASLTVGLTSVVVQV